MTHPVIRRRRAEQSEMIETARRYVQTLRERLEIQRAWVAGSVARGDFNVWSDIDLVLVAAELPERGLERQDVFIDAPARVQVVAYTSEELARALERRDPLATEASTSGIDVLGSGPAGERPPT